jgi:hypothetical protein
MKNNQEKPVRLAQGDVCLWVEAEASIMLKAISKSGDPVELSAEEARELASLLKTMADKID